MFLGFISNFYFDYDQACFINIDSGQNETQYNLLLNILTLKLFFKKSLKKK